MLKLAVVVMEVHCRVRKTRFVFPNVLSPSCGCTCKWTLLSWHGSGHPLACRGANLCSNACISVLKQLVAFEIKARALKWNACSTSCTIMLRDLLNVVFEFYLQMEQFF